MMIRGFATALLGLGCSFHIMAQEDIAALELNSFSFDEFDLPAFDENSVPVVLTATRIQQHQSDVPASVTILDSDLIKRIGAKDLPELLRYVPGMMIGPDRNNNADSVHYHGGPAALPKNLQVLINGRSMYRSGLAAVSWYELPVAVEEIRRIEVVRGPNSATYGANAYQAVINILTKHPSDTLGSKVVTEFGNNGDHYTYLRHGGALGDSTYRVSYTNKATDHFKDFVDDECTTPCRDDKRSHFFNVETHKQLWDAADLETSLVLHQSAKHIANPNEFQANDNKLEEQRIELGARYTKDLSSKHQIKVSGYFTQFNQRQAVDVTGVPNYALNQDLMALYSLNPEAVDGKASVSDGFRAAAESAKDQANPAILQNYWDSLTADQRLDLGLINSYVAANAFSDLSIVNNFLATLSPDEQALAAGVVNTPGLTDEVSGTVNADIDEYRFDIEIQDTYIYSPKLTLVSGLSFRQDVVNSDHYFNGELTNTTSRIFGSATWKTTENLNLHLGLMGEKESELDLVFAPRAAVNYKLTPSQSLRWVYSESVRSPDLFEQDAFWNFTVDNASPTNILNGITYYQTAQSEVELDHQKIVSRELGYYGRFQTLNAEVDLKYFVEEQTDVIYQSIKLEDFTVFDDNTIEFEGVELQGQFTPWDSGLIRAAGAHIEAEVDTPSGQVDATTLLRVYAQDQLALSWFQDWGHQFSTGLNYILYSKFEQIDEDVNKRDLFERVSISFQSNVRLGRVDVELAFRAQKDIESGGIIEDQNRYEDTTRVQFIAGLSF